MKMKLLNSMRVLLVAAGLCVGGDVWAAPTTVYTKELSGWSGSDDITSTEGTVGKWYHSGGLASNENWTGLTAGTTNGLKVCASASSASGSQYVPAVLTIAHTANSIVTLDAVWNIGSCSSDGSNPYCTFQFGDFLLKQCVRNSGGDAGKTWYTINDKQTQLSGKLTRDQDVTIHLVVNSSTREITALSVKQGDTDVISFSDLTSANNTFKAGSTYNTVTVSANSPASSSQRTYCYLKSISITEEAQAIETASVTFKYVDTENNDLSVVKADVTLNDVAVGTSFSDIVTAAYTATFFKGETNKYVYADTYTVTNNYTEVQSGSNIVTLKFTDYPATAYTVKAQVDGKDLTTLASGTAYLDGSQTVTWSKFLYVTDSWYEGASTGLALVTASNNIVFTAADIDYFFEAESMTCSRTYQDNHTGTEFSNGEAVAPYASASVATTSTVAAGVYTVSMMGVRWADYADNYLVEYSQDNTNWTTCGTITYAKAETGVKSLENVIVPADSYIRLRANDGSQTPRRYLDYIYMKKTADLPSTENIVVTAAGYATYVSNYNLDFTSATTKAYKVSVSEKAKAVLTAVEQVPAKTPVLLYVDGGNGSGEAITVITDAVAAVTGNDLVAGTGAAVATTDGDYTNMILNNVDDKVGFYFAAGQTVATNRAYLHIASSLAPDAAAAARMQMVFNDETTGVENVRSEVKDGQFFNLSGQRVASPVKGLYIVNGKKLIVK